MERDVLSIWHMYYVFIVGQKRLQTVILCKRPDRHQSSLFQDHSQHGRHVRMSDVTQEAGVVDEVVDFTRHSVHF